MTEPFILNRYWVTVQGFPPHIYYARSRQKALAKAWGDYCSSLGEIRFSDFMKIARAKFEQADEFFGDPITVSGRAGFYVSADRQYVRFAYGGSEDTFLAHPLDVLPVEYRRFTAYAEVQA